ncbi:DUF917 family protein [Bacillus thermophilus]|uniref:DUF917 family protein n=1 Tax=Siminovitchia thermophila TaxID=1245522 RepID=A0ABS2R631_9BACI|nr:DUF917 domain-containing protein [Siminovitchia thermophila]MBM7714830.1 DUF917 family protein [Siminovitchia thermophila]ONK21716.1 hypothetical protein BLX87_19680 [Bacillus sp. VT-16-64]
MSVYDLLKEWNVTSYKKITLEDLEDITVGSTLLATGGGGDPDIGFLWAQKIIENSHDIVLIDPEDVPDEEFITSVGCLGAPIVLTEKPPGGNEIFKSLEAISNFLRKKVNAIIPAEAGGVNMTIPMAVAGALGIPVIDADGMGRAFPELQMTSFYIGGLSPTPVAASNEKEEVCLVQADDGDVAERIIRSAAMAYGGISWISSYPMSGKDMKRTSIHRTVTQARNIGKIIRKNRAQNTEPVEEVVEYMNGSLVFKGKVVDLHRDFGSEMTKGFSSGTIVMEGIDSDKGSTAEILFQNEWLHLTINGKTRSLPPDLIILMDPETGEALRTDIIKYGYRGYIALMPADEKMTTEKGIEVCGPRAFGMDEDYVSYEILNGLPAR